MNQIACHDRYVFQFNPAPATDLAPSLVISCPGYPLRSPHGNLEYFPAESISLFSREAIVALHKFLTTVLVDTMKESKATLTELPEDEEDEQCIDNEARPNNHPSELSETLGQLFAGVVQPPTKSLPTVMEKLPDSSSIDL